MELVLPARDRDISTYEKNNWVGALLHFDRYLMQIRYFIVAVLGKKNKKSAACGSVRPQNK